MSKTSSSTNTYLLIPIALIAALTATAVIRGPSLVTVPGVGSAIAVAAPLILATYALMVLAVAGRGTVDLAIGPLMAFINVVVVRLATEGYLSSPIATFIVALGLGMLYQLAFALVVIYVRVQPIIVALSGFLALTGINLVILPRPGGVSPAFMTGWGAGTSIFSPILLILVIATAGWYLFTSTSFYSNLKMMGYDERAAWTSGVKTNIVRIGAHLIAGIYAGLGAICYTALISSGDPSRGQSVTLTAVTALVLGGVALSGGRGGAASALLGSVSIWLIGYVLATFNFGVIQAFMTQMVYGLILVLSLVLTLLVPLISRYVRFISPVGAFVVLGIIVSGVMIEVATHTTYASAGLVEATGSLSEKYFLVAPARVNTSGAAISLTQGVVLLAGLGVVSAVFAARMMDAEAQTRRLGLFLYVFILAMVVALFVAVLLESSNFQIGGPV